MLADLEAELKQNPSSNLSRRVDAARSALDELLIQQTESAMLYAKHRLYEMGDKPGHLLARLAAGRRESKAISSLVDATGCEQFKTKNVCNIMSEFYKKLYTSKLDSTSEEVGRFLEQVNLVSLKQDDREALCRPFTKDESIPTEQ